MIPIGNGKYRDWLTQDGLLCIEGWAREGMTEAQIAAKMGVSMSSLSDWKIRFPEVLEALKRGKAPVDVQVENALLKRALGYRFVETVTEYEMAETGIGEDGNPILEKRVKSVREVTKEVAPDVGAQAFWLKNRRPDRWREKREEKIQVTGADYSLIDEAAKEMRKALDETEPDAE